MNISEGSRVNVVVSSGYQFIGSVTTVIDNNTLWVINDYTLTMHVIDLNDVKDFKLIEGGY